MRPFFILLPFLLLLPVLCTALKCDSSSLTYTGRRVNGKIDYHGQIDCGTSCEVDAYYISDSGGFTTGCASAKYEEGECVTKTNERDENEKHHICYSNTDSKLSGTDGRRMAGDLANSVRHGGFSVGRSKPQENQSGQSEGRKPEAQSQTEVKLGGEKTDGATGVDTNSGAPGGNGMQYYADGGATIGSLFSILFIVLVMGH